jgi:hypothetical protein
MRRTALVLGLLAASLQAFVWANCCCVLICTHRNEVCADCGHDKKAAAQDCCKKDAPDPRSREDGQRCSHIEASSAASTAPAAEAPAVVSLEFETPPTVAAPAPLPVPLRTVARPARDAPLHLLHSALLI